MDFALLAGLTEDDRRALLSTDVRRRFARDQVITADRGLQTAADGGLPALTRGRIEVLDQDALARPAR